VVDVVAIGASCQEIPKWTQSRSARTGKRSRSSSGRDRREPARDLVVGAVAVGATRHEDVETGLKVMGTAASKPAERLT